MHVLILMTLYEVRIKGNVIDVQPSITVGLSHPAVEYPDPRFAVEFYQCSKMKIDDELTIM